MSKLSDIKTWQCEVCRKTITGPGRSLHLGIRSHIQAEVRRGLRKEKVTITIVKLLKDFTLDELQQVRLSAIEKALNISQQHPDSTSL